MNKLYIKDTLKEFLLSGITEYECVEGQIIYFDMGRSDTIGIYGFFLKPEYIKKGIFKEFLDNIISNVEIREIWVFQPNFVVCTILQTTMFQGQYFTNLMTGELVWERPPDTLSNKYKNLYYNKEKSEFIASELSLLRQKMRYFSETQIYDTIFDLKLQKYM